jgi:signal transduction histidine kinase
MNSATITFNTLNAYNPSSIVDPLESFAPPLIRREIPLKFIYTLTHEIRNPLTNINLATDVLKQLTTDEAQKVYLNIIMRNTERIKGIVNDLLALGNTTEIKLENHSVQYLLDEILMINEDRLVLKNVIVRKKFSKSDLKIKISRAEVKIALANIIINAIEAMPANDGLLEITTKLLRGFCVIVIRDNGTGISKENLTNIFKPYFTNKPDGMGLGLSVAQSILNANLLTINVRSEPGKGTMFLLSYKMELS